MWFMWSNNKKMKNKFELFLYACISILALLVMGSIVVSVDFEHKTDVMILLSTFAIIGVIIFFRELDKE
jgi:hypothetical protein